MINKRGIAMGFVATLALTIIGSAMWPTLLSAVGYTIHREPTIFNSTVAINGATALAGRVTITDSLITYSKSGIATVVADSTTKTFAVSGLVSTDAILVTVMGLAANNADTAVTARGRCDTNGSLQITLSGAVAAGSQGVKVSWLAIRPQ